MSVIAQISPFAVADFLEWKSLDRLIIAPKFQRRPVWSEKAKSYLIDSIIRGMPIPPLYLRVKVEADTQRAVREVVDGQQRLRSVFEFAGDKFAISSVHNKKYGGCTYSDLPEDIQDQFLGYNFSVNILRDVSDQKVLEVFSRINTYAVPLNPQELRNAKYFGAFKQKVYSIAHDHYQFWTSNRIVRDRQIARMREAQLVSEILLTIIDGFSPTKKSDLDEIYERFDDEFPEGDRLESQFREVIDIISDIFNDDIKESAYRRLTMFFSLFLVVYDARFGLPDTAHSRVQFTSKLNEALKGEFMKLSNIIYSDEPPEEYSEFLDASQRATADPTRRVTRHHYLWECVEDGLESVG